MGFSGVVDLLEMKQITWDEDSLGAQFSINEIPDNLLEKAKSHREKLLETVSEVDDGIMEKYLGDEPIEIPDLIAAIRKAIMGLKLVPVLCGSALKNKGIQPLLDAIVHYLPSPLDVPPITGDHVKTGEKIICPPKANHPLAALIFKVAMPEGRMLSYVRVYSGKLQVGKEVYNPNVQKKEKISRILRMHANKRERIDEMGPGGIVGVVGLKNSITGDTLCTSENPVLLERIDAYEPVISVAMEPKTRADQEKLDLVLDKFLKEDPTLRVRLDEDTGQTIVSGMGELHLEVVISRMVRGIQHQCERGQAPGGVSGKHFQPGRGPCRV